MCGELFYLKRILEPAAAQRRLKSGIINRKENFVNKASGTAVDIHYVGDLMTNQMPIYRTVLTILFTAISFFATPTFAGGASTGGGYTYRDTTIKHVKLAQVELISALNAINQDEIDAITKEYGGERFERQRLIDYIKGIEFAELDNGERVESGKKRSLDMEYSFERGGYITALRPFFDAFHKLNLAPGEQLVLKRKILHEISHLFKIGIEDDEKSVELSTALANFLWFQRASCGATGSIDERLKQCEPLNFIYKEKTEKNGPIVLKSKRVFYSSNLHLIRLSPFEYTNYWKPDVIDYEIRDARNINGALIAQINDISLFAGYSATSTTKIFTPEIVCSLVSNLDGQVTWKPATVDNIDLINPVAGNDIVALANGKVRYLNRGMFGNDSGTITEITNDRRVRTNLFRVFCTGTAN